MSLSLKESSETEYRIELLEYGGYLDGFDQTSVLKEKIVELLKVLTKIVITTREKDAQKSSSST